MSVLLTHGYFLGEDLHEQAIMKPYPPLGLLYLAAYLNDAGIAVEVFDTTFASKQDFFDRIAQARPGVVGLYCNLMTKKNVLEMAAYCNERGIAVVLGGPDPPYYAEEYLQHGADVIVRGEGEETMAELLPALDQSGPHRLHAVKGISFRDEAGMMITTEPRPLIKDLNTLPFPQRSAIDISRYLEAWRSRHGTTSLSLICARGCPYTCTWCSHSVYGETHRRRSPVNVASELEELIARYAPDKIWYADDVFAIHRTWLFNYAAELRRRQIKIPFECISREDRLSEPVIKTLAEMGCFRLWIGSESGSQRILDAMERRTNARRVTEMIHLLKRYGIETGVFIMLGYDGEDESDLAATVSFLKESDPDHFLTTLAYPIKGTPYYARVEERIAGRGDWANSTDRDLDVKGRYSKRYYRHATRWMVSEVALHRQVHSEKRNLAKITKHFINSNLGSMGMLWTKHMRLG